MPYQTAAAQMQSAFGLLERVAKLGGVRDLTALTLTVDNWLIYDEPIPLPGGKLYPEPGYRLFETPAGQLWLLPRGRLLTVPPGQDETPEVTQLVDLEANLDRLAERLRPGVLRQFLGGEHLAAREGFAVAPAVAELLTAVWDLDEAGRLAVFGALADAMRHDDGWDQAAVRLKSGLERGLGDRSAAVRAVCARALVRIGAGLGPTPPVGDPARGLAVLFAVPHADVRAAALAELAGLPEAAIEAVAPVLETHIHAALADMDPATRELAAAVELKLSGGGRARSLAAELDHADAGRRIAALDQLAATLGHSSATSPPEAWREVEILLPKVLNAADNPDPAVRRAALGVLGPVLEGEPGPLGQRILITLLANSNAEVARTALDFLKAHPAEAPEIFAALSAALDGPPANRPAVVGLLSRHYQSEGPIEATEGYVSLVRHRDPEVRQAALQGIARDAAGRANVLERLHSPLAERLRDPEPRLRLQTAEALAQAAYPQAAEMMLFLAVDPDEAVRHGVLRVLEGLGASSPLERARTLVAATDRLFALEGAGGPEARNAWAAGLHALTGDPLQRIPELLAAVLVTIPPDTTDPFRRWAIEELDTRILALAEGLDLIALCRRLAEPASGRPEHAARLAGAVATRDPAALDFLWTLYTESQGAGAEAARRALAEIGPLSKSDAVRRELVSLIDLARDDGQKDVLRTLLAGNQPG